MTIKKFILILIMFSFFLACNKTPTQIDQVELREDLSESEFKEAIIGKWVSVYEIQGKENVEYLELNRNGEAKIIIKKNSIRKELEGNYNINFLRPPAEGMVTLAELTIKTSKENIILSRVNFGLHNAFPAEVFFLRIDKEPYGVLKKIT